MKYFIFLISLLVVSAHAWNAIEFHVLRDLGCWKDDLANPILPSIGNDPEIYKLLVLNGTIVDPVECVQVCAKKAAKLGYNIIAVRHGWYCGAAIDADIKYKKYGNSTDCDPSGTGNGDSVQVYEVDVVVDVQYEALGCLYELPGVEIMPSIEGQFLELKDDATTRLDPVAKCARAAESLGYRVFAIREDGTCTSAANALAIFELYNTTCDPEALSIYNRTSFYQLTSGKRIEVNTEECKTYNRFELNNQIAILEHPSGALANPITIRNDSVAHCVRYAAGLGSTAVGIGDNGYCTSSQKKEVYLNKTDSNSCNITDGSGSDKAYQVYSLTTEELDFRPRISSQPLPHYIENIGCILDNVSSPVLSVLENKTFALNNSLFHRLQSCANISMSNNMLVFGLMNDTVCVGTNNQSLIANLKFTDSKKDMWSKTQLYTANIIQKNPKISGIGCFHDHIISSLEGTAAVLKGNSIRRQNAVSKCAKIASMRGYKVFGIQNGACYSQSDAHLIYKQHGQAICNLNGKGYTDINQMYEIKQSEKLNIKNLGCWKNDMFQTIPSAEGLILELSDQYKKRDDALQKCAEFAHDAGNDVFALQDGGMCMTSSTAKWTYSRIGSSQECKSDGKGGMWALQVYEITGQFI